MKKCLIAIDGIDGSGKETQTKLLLSSLESDGIPHKYLSFPTYREPWSDLVTLYLGGGFGGHFAQLHPCVGRVQLHLEPRFKFLLLGPKRRHLRAGVAVDHSSCPPIRRRRIS